MPLSTLPGTKTAAGMVPRGFEHSLANPKKPLTNLTETHKADPLTQTAHQVYYPGLDIRLFDERLPVEFDNGHIRIHYFCDPSIYQGPVEFHLKVSRRDGGQIVNVLDETFTDQDSSDGFTGIAFTWPSDWDWLFKMSYELTINPRHALYETNYENNRKTGYLYRGGLPYIDLIRSPFFPELKDHPIPQRVRRARGWVHDAIRTGTCWFYDPYDPDTNMLMVNVNFQIENPSSSDRTVHFDISYDSMDGEASNKGDVQVAAGGSKYVTQLLGINLQPKNYIRIYSGGRIYLNLGIDFPGLPYDPTASLNGPLYVSPNRRFVSASKGGIVRYIVNGGDDPWHITTDDPAFPPHPDMLSDAHPSITKDENGNYYFYVIVPPHTTPKIVNYRITDALNHSVGARLFILPPQN